MQKLHVCGTPVTWNKQQSPMATARHPRFTAFSEAPTNAAYRPDGPSRRRTRAANGADLSPPQAWMAPRPSKKSGPWGASDEALDQQRAQRAEKLLSVAPSATATRQRVGESEPRMAQASSYSVRAFPAFWEENARPRTAPGRWGEEDRSPEICGTGSDVED